MYFDMLIVIVLPGSVALDTTTNHKCSTGHYELFMNVVYSANSKWQWHTLEITIETHTQTFTHMIFMNLQRLSLLMFYDKNAYRPIQIQLESLTFKCHFKFIINEQSS